MLAAAVGWPDLTLDAADEAPTAASLPALAEAVDAREQEGPALAEAIARLGAQELQTRAIGALLRPDLSLSATLSGRAGGAMPSSGTGPNLRRTGSSRTSPTGTRRWS